MNLLDLMDCETLSGKTCLDSSPKPTTPSDVSWARLSDMITPSRSLTGPDGPARVWLTDHGAGPRGGFSTLNISDSPNGARACSLSRILETEPIPPRYYLSARACAGILKRAARRGKTLPELLAAALGAVAGVRT